MFEIVSKSQNRTRMTRIARIFTDTSYPRVSAQSAFHRICFPLKNTAPGTKEGTPVDSVDPAEGIIAHYSKEKKILEIEILDASKVVQMNELNVSLKGSQAAVVNT